MTCDREANLEVALGGPEDVAEHPANRVGSGVIVAREPRVLPRIRTELTAQLSTLEPNLDCSFTLTEAKTLDVADGGLGLTVDEFIAVGQRVVVEIELSNGQRVEQNGRVAWTFRDPDGTRFAGVAFDAIVAGFAAHAAGAEPAEPNGVVTLLCGVLDRDSSAPSSAGEAVPSTRQRSSAALPPIAG